MGIRILFSPGPYGGIITGQLDSPIDPSRQAIAIYQMTSAGWKPRRLDVPAARLWSCDIGHAFDYRVERWMAVLVPKHFEPAARPMAWASGVESDEADASPLTAIESIGYGDRLFRGASVPSDPSRQDGLFPFAWWLGRGNEREPTPGWVGMGSDDLTRSSDWWAMRLGDGIQHAMIQVAADDVKHFDPGATSELCTLPSYGVHALAFTSPIDVRILTRSKDGLAGVVTGLGCAYDHRRELKELEAPEPDEQLYAVAWAIDANGVVTVVGPGACDPSGYWEFETFFANARNSVRFTVAVTVYGFTPKHAVPTHVGGDIIALTSFNRNVGIPSLGAHSGFKGP